MSTAKAASAKEIMHWLRTYYDVPFEGVAGGSNGAMYCQVLDSMYRGKVPLNTVNFDAKSDRQIDNNYKILEKVLERTSLDYKLNVTKLKSGAIRESLELWQFLFTHWSKSDAVSRRYDASKKRRRAREARYAKLGLEPPKDGSSSKRGSTSKSSSSDEQETPRTKARSLKKKKEKPEEKKSTKNKLPGLRLSSGVLPDASGDVRTRSPSTNSVRSSNAGSPRESMRGIDLEPRAHISSVFPLEHELSVPSSGLSFMAPPISLEKKGPGDDLEASLVELADSFAGMTLERNIYFSKLRRIEKALQEFGEAGRLAETVETILMRPPPMFGDDEFDDYSSRPMRNDSTDDESRSSGDAPGHTGYSDEEEEDEVDEDDNDDDHED